VKHRFVPVEESFKAWEGDASFVRAYRDLDDEFALAAALIDARGQAGLSQGVVAARMQTSQQAISRLEGGRGNPSLETLKRFAKATGTRLRIRFEAAKRAR
jgi:ribosome-binding protein aMBF1 (putative translation factor)